MRRHNKISIAQSLRALKLPNCRCLAALNINILTLQTQFDLVHVKTDKYEGTETTIPTSINFNVGELLLERKFQLLKRGATSPGGVF